MAFRPGAVVTAPPGICRSNSDRVIREVFMKNIFVGNLDFHVAEDELRQLFAQFGQVDRVSVMMDRVTGRSRGFAFVEMTNNEEGEKAIAELNGSQFSGRTLNVNEARPKVERGGERNSGFDRGGSRRRDRRW